MSVSRIVLCLALAGISGSAMAADAADTPPAPSVFVTKAAQAGMAEVELGNVALSKSQNPEIRNFAQRMVTDHGKANAELATIARANGIDVPTQLDAEHQAMVQKMKAKSGAEFDAEYSRHMSMDHSKAISLFESATKTSDPELAKFAQKTLPTLREHKKLTQKLPAQQASQ